MVEDKQKIKKAEEELIKKKESLQEELKKISKKESENYLIKGKCGNYMQVLTTYNTKQYGFAPGDFITNDLISTGSIALCVGISHGCLKADCDEIEGDELWFLSEGFSGITSFDSDKLAKCTKI